MRGTSGNLDVIEIGSCIVSAEIGNGEDITRFYLARARGAYVRLVETQVFVIPCRNGSVVSFFVKVITAEAFAIESMRQELHSAKLSTIIQMLQTS